jgi:hypothetical protein
MTTTQAHKIAPIVVLLVAWAVFILPMLWMRSHRQWLTGGVVAIALVLIWADFVQFGSRLGLRAYGEAKRQRAGDLMSAAWSFAKNISLATWARASIVLGAVLLIAALVGVTHFLRTLPWQGWALLIMLLLTALILRTKLSRFAQ